MKLRMLAVAAGFFVVPAIAGAQTTSDSTKTTTVSAVKDSTLEPKPVPPSDGTT